jgi:hypothetical protein
MNRVPVIARLRLPDGREYDCHTDVEECCADSEEFFWTDGNGGCDCNRSLYLNREYHLGLGRPDRSGFICLPCGDTIRLISLIIAGVEQLDALERAQA